VGAGPQIAEYLAQKIRADLLICIVNSHTTQDTLSKIRHILYFCDLEYHICNLKYCCGGREVRTVVL